MATIDEMIEVYWRLKAKVDDLQKEQDSYTHTERAFSGPPYRLNLLKEILRGSVTKGEKQ